MSNHPASKGREHGARYVALVRPGRLPGREVTVNPLGIRVLVRDLPFGRPWLVRWHKRRMFWDQTRWPLRTFAERSAQLGPRQRLTARLRAALERAASGSLLAVLNVAREYGVSWWSVNHALVAAAASLCGWAPEGVRLLGVDETRARSVRWMASRAG